MKASGLFALALTSGFLYAQDITTVVEDFNHDGYTDTLKSFYDGGSGFSGTYITLIDGKTNAHYELNNFGCFCDIKRTILIPPELNSTENEPFLNAISKVLLPKKKDEPDASLQWLITAHQNYQVLNDNLYYDLFIHSPTKWHKGKLTLPSTYSLDLQGDVLHHLYFTEDEVPEWYDSIQNKGWLIYYGHNHFNIKDDIALDIAVTSSTYKIYTSQHGIMVKKGGKSAWIYVNDFRLTGGPEKLRHKSIGEVSIYDKYVIFQLINAPYFSNPIFIIDIEKGLVGKLKTEDETYESFTIIEDRLHIATETHGISYNIESLIRALGE